ncbi:cupin domain-containing protein [Fodinicola feengrottensis]|uniref:Cupin type-2 domain-containing protein n=1 Tax=Fodinicola feengrottensis TaxID=435914 RepID=A0ABN2IF55_9ACTN|nr:cupin domain-containing protein [Fodinicola feengrottensis]
MRVISETEDRTVTTPNAVMASLAGPSQGSAALSTWSVRMAAGASGPVHIIDREQVWMLLSGALAFTADGETGTATAGQAVVVPAGVTRQIRAGDTPAEALVCMPVGGQVTVPGDDSWRPLPWGQ